MNQAHFRFYADLNDFLPDEYQQQSFAYPVHDGRQTVKHLIEAIGVPHTEVELILVNGRSVTFDHIVQASEKVSIYPPFATVQPADALPLRPALQPPFRFVLDIHLGKLARYLRLLGFDTIYFENDVRDPELARISNVEQRIMLTRDRGLLKRDMVTYGYCLRTRNSEEQLTAVLHRFQLHDQIRPWTRCLRCNGLMHPVPKEEIIDRLEPKTKKYFDKFHMCNECEQIYWQGSHVSNLQALIERAKM